MMNSRKSWVNIPLLKNIIKNNLFPAKVSLIIFVGVFILSLISGSNSGFSQICIVVYGISAVVLTTIYPCFIQSYQVNKTKSINDVFITVDDKMRLVYKLFSWIFNCASYIID